MTNHERIIVFLASAALSWLLIVGVEGKWGIVAGCVLMIAVIILMILNIKPPFIEKNQHTPLLTSLFLVTASVCYFVLGEQKVFWGPISIIGLFGFIEIAYWIKDGHYKEKDIRHFVLNELQLGTIIDLGLLVLVSLDCIENSEFSRDSILVIAFLFVDLVRQILINKGDKQPLR